MNSRYHIGKVLGYGGFGVIYLAWDAILEAKVAIKEYLPSEFSHRRRITQIVLTVSKGKENTASSTGIGTSSTTASTEAEAEESTTASTEAAPPLLRARCLAAFLLSLSPVPPADIMWVMQLILVA